MKSAASVTPNCTPVDSRTNCSTSNVASLSSSLVSGTTAYSPPLGGWNIASFGDVVSERVDPSLDRPAPASVGETGRRKSPDCGENPRASDRIAPCSAPMRTISFAICGGARYPPSGSDPTVIEFWIPVRRNEANASDSRGSISVVGPPGSAREGAPREALGNGIAAVARPRDAIGPPGAYSARTSASIACTSSSLKLSRFVRRGPARTRDWKKLRAALNSATRPACVALNLICHLQFSGAAASGAAGRSVALAVLSRGLALG